MLNIRSLRTSWNTFLASIDDFADKIDIIALCEINIKESETAFYSLTGFKQFTLTRENKKGGGLMLFIRNKYDFVDVQMKFYLTLECIHGLISSQNIQIYIF